MQPPLTAVTTEFNAIDQVLLCSAYNFCLHVELVQKTHAKYSMVMQYCHPGCCPLQLSSSPLVSDRPSRLTWTGDRSLSDERHFTQFTVQ